MAQRQLSETGWYHITTRAAGQIALFEDDSDRKKYLGLLKAAHDATGATLIAWVLMTDHVHLIVDFGEEAADISEFMFRIDSPYSRYFNAKTGRSGTLFQGAFWSKPILTDEQLIATVYYVHMNPEAAGISPMREYRWSSYREYNGLHWITDTSTVLDLFGGFEAFDAFEGSPDDVVRGMAGHALQDGDVLALGLELSGASSSSELRSLSRSKRDELIRALFGRGASMRMIARTLGIGAGTVSRILNR